MKNTKNSQHRKVEIVNSHRNSQHRNRKIVNSHRKIVNSPRKIVNSPIKIVNIPRKIVNSNREIVNSKYKGPGNYEPPSTIFVSYVDDFGLCRWLIAAVPPIRRACHRNPPGPGGRCCPGPGPCSLQCFLNSFFFFLDKESDLLTSSHQLQSPSSC